MNANRSYRRPLVAVVLMAIVIVSTAIVAAIIAAIVLFAHVAPAKSLYSSVMPVPIAALTTIGEERESNPFLVKR